MRLVLIGFAGFLGVWVLLLAFEAGEMSRVVSCPAGYGPGFVSK